MFTSRGPGIKATIDEQFDKLTDIAKERHAILHPVVVVAGEPGGFEPITDAFYATLSEAQKSDNNHKIRVDYILSKQREYIRLKRPLTEKLTDWLTTNKLVTVGGPLAANVAEKVVDYYFAHEAAINAAVHNMHSLLPHIPLTSAPDTSARGYTSLESITPEQLSSLRPEQIFTDFVHVELQECFRELTAVEYYVVKEKHPDPDKGE